MIFGEMARDAASYVAAQRQQAVDDLRHVAEDMGLVAETGRQAAGRPALCNSIRRGLRCDRGAPTASLQLHFR